MFNDDLYDEDDFWDDCDDDTVTVNDTTPENC